MQATAEDFLESLNQDAGSALAELVNLILRSCGCNDTVNADEAVDYDGVVDTLDNFTEGLKKVMCTHSYCHCTESVLGQFTNISPDIQVGRI